MLTGGNAAEDRFTYRPNWGLAGMTPPEQTAAMVFGFSAAPVVPGQVVRAVIVVLYPQTVQQWEEQVDIGSRLPMYEGSRVVGEGRVLWRSPAVLPLDDQKASTFDSWLTSAP